MNWNIPATEYFRNMVAMLLEYSVLYGKIPLYS